MKFDSKEFENLFEFIRTEHPNLNKYLCYMAVVAWSENQQSQRKNNKKSKKKGLPDISPVEIDKNEIANFCKGAIEVSNDIEL